MCEEKKPLDLNSGEPPSAGLLLPLLSRKLGRFQKVLHPWVVLAYEGPALSRLVGRLCTSYLWPLASRQSHLALWFVTVF